MGRSNVKLCPEVRPEVSNPLRCDGKAGFGTGHRKANRFLIHFGAMGRYTNNEGKWAGAWFLIHFGAMGSLDELVTALVDKMFLIHFGAMGSACVGLIAPAYPKVSNPLRCDGKEQCYELTLPGSPAFLIHFGAMGSADDGAEGGNDRQFLIHFGAMGRRRRGDVCAYAACVSNPLRCDGKERFQPGGRLLALFLIHFGAMGSFHVRPFGVHLVQFLIHFGAMGSKGGRTKFIPPTRF